MDQEEFSLEALLSAVKEKEAKWEPAITNLSMLSDEEKMQRLGLMPTTTELELSTKFGLDKPIMSRWRRTTKTKKESNPGSVGLPSRWDWRNVSGVRWTSPTRDQDGCGSCVAFGTLAALEALLRIRTYQDHSKSLDLSEAHLLFCGGGSCSGWHMNHACNYLQANGVPDEACFPYSHGLTTRACTPCSNWQARIGYTKIPSWSNTKDVDQTKKNIVGNGPQITGMAVYQDFFSYAGGIYEHVHGGLAGYHCVAVVGYDDLNECWICQNSWGTGWGEADGGQRGWFRIKYGECGIEDVFGMWDMVVQSARGHADAQYLLVDYSFTSNVRTLWAHAGGGWRKRPLSEGQVAGIAEIVMKADRLDVWWSDSRINFARCWKKY
jgi:C1A family cysteine protease